MFKMSVKLSLLVMCIVATLNADLPIDRKGYIVYCPRDGDFDVQTDRLLGALAFARAMDRTLVLAPWIEYHQWQIESVQVPFDTYFSVEAINKFTRAVTMENFMKELAPKVWPVGKRVAFCYMTRDPEFKTCNAKEGSPSESFWGKTFNVDFDSSVIFGPDLYYDVSQVREWNSRYPRSEYPVLAFTGTPSASPVKQTDLVLQRYVRWSREYEERAIAYINKNLETPFIGIHLRNGKQFEQICDHIPESKRNLLASAQCLGYDNENGIVTKYLCQPSDNDIIKQVKRAVSRYNAIRIHLH
jgi:peptide-O-fucosyltransferase